jgi:hypothetical protein
MSAAKRALIRLDVSNAAAEGATFITGGAGGGGGDCTTSCAHRAEAAKANPTKRMFFIRRNLRVVFGRVVSVKEVCRQTPGGVFQVNGHGKFFGQGQGGSRPFSPTEVFPLFLSKGHGRLFPVAGLWRNGAAQVVQVVQASVVQGHFQLKPGRGRPGALLDFWRFEGVTAKGAENSSEWLKRASAGL